MTYTEHITLKRAGFTDREINTMRVKFKNLFTISPFLTSEFNQYHQLLSAVKEQRLVVNGMRDTEVIMRMQEMAQESLPPVIYDDWLKVRSTLVRTREST
jgi:hypothetical protein